MTDRMRMTMMTKPRTTMTAAHRGKTIHSGTSASSSKSVGLDAMPAGSTPDCGVSSTSAVLIGCENADVTNV